MRRHVESEMHVAQPLRHDREPPIGLAVGLGGEALGDLPLEHQGQAFVAARFVEPAQQQRGRDVVRQIGDDLARRGHQVRDVDSQRIAFDDRQPAGESGFEFAQRGDAALVAFDRGDVLGTFQQQRSGETAGAGADLDDVGVIERRSLAGDAARQIEIEQEILAKRLTRPELEAANDVAKRRKLRRQYFGWGLAGRRQVRRHGVRQARPRVGSRQ